MKSYFGTRICQLAILLALVGFFYAPYWFGGGAILLGLIGLKLSQKLLAWSSIVLGAIVLLLPFIL